MTCAALSAFQSVLGMEVEGVGVPKPDKPATTSGIVCTMLYMAQYLEATDTRTNTRAWTLVGRAVKMAYIVSSASSKSDASSHALATVLSAWLA